MAWDYITKTHGDKFGVICLECFIELLLIHGLNPEDCIEEIQIIGHNGTKVFKNGEVIIWP